MSRQQGGGGPGGSPPHLVEDLYLRHRQQVYAFAWARLSERQDALDVVSEVFLRAWRSADRLAGLPDGARFRWLLACARHLIVDRYRHRAVVARAPDPREPLGKDPAVATEEAEALQVLDRAIGVLPAPLREILALRVLGAMTSAQIGGALGIPAGTVRYRLLQARRLLRQALGGGGGREA